MTPSKRQRRDILVHDVPDEIRKALIADAKKRDLSINEVAVTILADRFRVKREAKVVDGRSAFGASDGLNLTIRAGAAIHQKVAVEAAKRQGTLRGVVLETLAIHYGIDPPPLGRRSRKPREKTPA